MISKKLTVSILLGIVVAAFAFGMYNYQRRVQNSQMEKFSTQDSRLVRMHSPVFGPQGAPVTIVVKDLMKQYPNDVRLVLRYAPFHAGSDHVVALLEAAKRQDKYPQVLEAVLAAQPAWASHGQPNIDLAFKAAEEAGLDLLQARADAAKPEVDAVLQQDLEDLTALEVTKTPTFFVNGRGLPSFGPEQLATLVAEEVSKIKK
jgi:hypothetical protein